MNATVRYRALQAKRVTAWRWLRQARFRFSWLGRLRPPIPRQKASVKSMLMRNWQTLKTMPKHCASIMTCKFKLCACHGLTRGGHDDRSISARKNPGLGENLPRDGFGDWSRCFQGTRREARQGNGRASLPVCSMESGQGTNRRRRVCSRD